MKKSGLSDEQMEKILRDADESTLGEVALKHSIRKQMIYSWRRLYDVMQVNDIKKLKGLINEGARLKKLLAERDLQLDVMIYISEKILVSSGARRAMALHACKL